MNKYWLIVIGVTLFVFVTAMLVISQPRRAKPAVVENKPVVTSKQPVSSNTLTVIQPQNGAVVKNAQILVFGKTAPNADVFVNDKDTVADAKGDFSVAFTLEEGENYILVGSTDAKGNFAEQELSVTYSKS